MKKQKNLEKKNMLKEVKSKESAYSTSLYYGFTAIETPKIEKEDYALANSIKSKAKNKDKNSEYRPILEGKVALLRNYENKTIPGSLQPANLYYEGNIGQGKDLKSKKIFNLDILGSNKSVCEATLIKAAFAILKDAGYKNLSIEINCLGDKESITRFVKEMSNYCRKNIASLPHTFRQAVKKDVLAILSLEGEKYQNIKENTPQSISFLSESSQNYFKEVLEYIEQMGISYKMNNCLTGDRDYSSHTVFQIVNNDEEKDSENYILAFGSRYNVLSKKMGWKKELPATGITIYIPKSVSKKNSEKNFKKARFYFIQLGFDAKMKSLEVIELLRQSKIPVQQSLSKDKLGAQLAMAENLGYKYIIIMGQKEAMENSVLVRNIETRSQETVAIADLAKYLKKIK
ncbi:hypothetical protein IT397_03035 [Candidatus Nomurabacteria bacterium]|nr:hypothetical protein [Candidatus Nomurabacteria bacterium]